MSDSRRSVAGATAEDLRKAAMELRTYQEGEFHDRAARLETLADSLESAVADTERVDWLNGRLNWFTTQGPAFDYRYANIREAIDAGRQLTPENG